MLLKLFPSAFNVVLLLGALYVAWIGISLLRSRAFVQRGIQIFTALPVSHVPPRCAHQLLNPKAYVFMLAIFPQFFRPEYGALWVQAAVLWLIIAVTQAAVYGAVALLASQARGWLETNPAVNSVLARSVGVMLVLAAMFTGYEGWHRF